MKTYIELKREKEKAMWQQVNDVLRARLGNDQPPACDHHIQIECDSGAWKCYLCNAAIKCNAARRAAGAAQATDPLRRWCGKHDEPFFDMGGGPGGFSSCESCMAEEYAKPRRPLSDFEDFVTSRGPRVAP